MSGSRKRLSHNVLSFADFMYRSRVLNLYRDMLRVSRRIDDGGTGNDGLTDRIRTEFKAQMNVREKEKRTTYMAHAQLQLKQLHSMEITLGRRNEDAGGASTNDDSAERDTPECENMGEGWPWEK